MEALKKAVIVKLKLINDVETLFSRLLVLGQQRSVDVAEIFQFKVSQVPTALIDEYGCLRKAMRQGNALKVSVQLHVLRAHHQMLLWKSEDQRDPPEEARDIDNFWLEY